MKKYIKSFIIFLIAFLPIAAFAATATGLVTCGNPGQPVCDFNALTGLVNSIINWFLGISVSVAAITFAYAGAQILLNQSNPTKLEDFKGVFGKTAIGLLIVLCAWLVVHTVIAALVPGSSTDTSGGIGALHFLGN